MSDILLAELKPVAARHILVAILHTAFSQIIDLLKLRYQQRQRLRADRHAVRILLHLEGDLLRDIGVTRQDVIWASALPPEISASGQLELIARRNRHH